MVGEPIALVVAESRYTAEDGAARSTVDYEPLPAVMTIEDALADGRRRDPRRDPGQPLQPASRCADGRGGGGASRPPSRDRARAAPAALRGGGDGGARGHRRRPAATARLTVWLSSQTPHLVRTGRSAQFLGAARDRDPGDLARRRRRVRPEVRPLSRRRSRCAAASRHARQAGQVDERPGRGPAHHRPRPRADPPGQGGR